MLCERCKIREANIQYTEVIGGVKAEHNLCAHCARELDFGPYSAMFDGDMPLGRLLSGLLGLGENTQKKDKMKGVVCPTCKLSYEEFVRDSCFGCQDCYGFFDLLISDNIRQLQGSDVHSGKRPKYNNTAADSQQQTDGGPAAGQDGSAAETIKILEARLKDALSREEYENAALYRDKIRALKGGADHAEMV